MTSLFTRIVAGEIPAHKVRENADYLAFLDIRPVQPGHTLVIPKREIDHFFDLPDELLAGLMVFAKPIAAALLAESGAARIGNLVLGDEVPHAHLHLIPINNGFADLDITKAKPAEDADLAAMAARLRTRLESSTG